MRKINTSLTVTNETDVRGQALLALIKKYITFSDGYYGFKSLGVHEEVTFPVVFVEPKTQVLTMNTTAKHVLHITYAIYWYVRDALPEDTITQSTFIGEALAKLFSNNALNDIGVANPPSNKFKQYANPAGGYFWLDSDMTEIAWSVNYLNPKAQPAYRYERSGRLLLKIMDEILK